MPTARTEATPHEKVRRSIGPVFHVMAALRPQPFALVRTEIEIPGTNQLIELYSAERSIADVPPSQRYTGPSPAWPVRTSGPTGCQRPSPSTSHATYWSHSSADSPEVSTLRTSCSRAASCLLFTEPTSYQGRGLAGHQQTSPARPSAKAQPLLQKGRLPEREEARPGSGEAEATALIETGHTCLSRNARDTIHGELLSVLQNGRLCREDTIRQAVALGGPAPEELDRGGARTGGSVALRKGVYERPRLTASRFPIIDQHATGQIPAQKPSPPASAHAAHRLMLDRRPHRRPRPHQTRRTTHLRDEVPLTALMPVRSFSGRGS